MSLLGLLARCDDRRVRSLIHLNRDTFEKERIDCRNCVFVAALWSGKSQLAFRRLCDALATRPTLRVPVLLLDTDLELPEQIAENAIGLNEGNGVLLVYESDKLIGQATGANSQDLAKVVDNLLLINMIWVGEIVSRVDNTLIVNSQVDEGHVRIGSTVSTINRSFRARVVKIETYQREVNELGQTWTGTLTLEVEFGEVAVHDELIAEAPS